MVLSRWTTSESADREKANFVYSDRIEVMHSGERTVQLGPQPEVGRMVAAGKLLPTGLVRRLGGYRKLFWEEIDLYLRLLESGEVRTAHVSRPLYRYRVGRGGMTEPDAARMLKQKSDLPATLTAPASGLFLERVYYPGDRRDHPLQAASVVPTP